MQRCTTVNVYTVSLDVHCGVESSFTLFDSLISGIVFIGHFCVLILPGFLGRCVLSLLDSLFLLLWSSGICIVTLLDFLFFWHIFLLFVVFFVVFFRFDLCGPKFLDFLVAHTTSFYELTLSSELVFKRTYPRMQWQGKLIQKRSP